MKLFYKTLFFVLAFSIQIYAQTGAIKGRVYNETNNEPIPFCNIVVQGTSIGTAADEEGRYEITNLAPGQYNVEATFIGFKRQVVYEIQVTNARPALVNIGLEEEAKKLEEVTVSAASGFYKPDESPLSLRTIGTTEIKQTPGGNRDISRVVRSLPGVASVPSFRNDIIIRGGAPSENTFYLDGIQIPVINHFQTQGSSGGPVGIINVDLLREVNFYSGAFPANRGNTMSSVFDFQLKEGRYDKWAVNGIIGATDLGLTFDGPVSDNSSLVLSARRSYLKFLFNIFNLPFLPVYNDLQFKYKWKLDDKNHFTVIGIGAIDDFELNLDAPQKAATEEEREEAEYLLNILPVSTQWNYTYGIKYEHFRASGNTIVVLSSNALNNASVKYANNDDSDADNLLQDYNSREIENRLRIENNNVKGGYSFNYGLNLETARYETEDFTKLVTQQGFILRDFASDLSLIKWGVFGQISGRYLDSKLVLSLGVRADANNYADEMNNLADQLSPRFSASYMLLPWLSANFNTGIYYQLPSYIVLGYRASTSGPLVNKENGVKFIQSNHLVGGLEFDLKRNARVTVEGFYKRYHQYPFLLEDSISLANLGADFGIIGNAPVTSTSDGKSYGVEFLFQQKLYKGVYGLLSYTWVRSLFEDKNGSYVPSAWDNRHLVSLTGGIKLKNNWEVGVRWLFTGGAPYTPVNVNETIRRENWDVRPFGIPDYDRLNSERIRAFHQLDIRIDKKYFFPKWSLNVYFDVQNAYNHITTFEESVTVVRDAEGSPVVDPNNDNFYLPKFIPNTYGNVLPTIGVIIEL